MLTLLGAEQTTSLLVVMIRDHFSLPGKNKVLTEHNYMGPELTPAEGFILGVGAKMLTIAGPVIVYGVPASVVYGLIYWIWTAI